MKQKSFIMYNDQKKLFDQLTDQEAGKLIKAIFMYLDDEDTDNYLEDRMMQILFNTLVQQIERDKQKYADKCKKLRENGSKGGKARADNMKHMQANVSLNDTDNDTDNKNVIPSLNELSNWTITYARENGLNSTECLQKATEAHAYYTKCMTDSNKRTWIDSKGQKIVNWKLKIARVWFKDMKAAQIPNINGMNVC